MGLNYNPALDGLRALAVSSVVIHHVWDKAVPGGWLGVDVFFVLSGYLITRILAQELESSGKIDFTRFYLKRALRLAPALMVMVVGVALLTPFRNIDPLVVVESSALALVYLMNWARAFDFGSQGALGHSWSVAIEEQFYLLWPILFLLFGRFRGRAAFALVAAVIAWRSYLLLSGAPVERVYSGLDTRTDGILLGCALALSAPPVRLIALAGKTAIVPMIILVILAMALPAHAPVSYTIGLPVIIFCSAWLLLAAQAGGGFARQLSAPPLVYLGRISYGVYLWHFPIILLVRPHLPEWLWFSLPLAGVACAVASYHLLEVRFLALKGRLDRPRVRKAAPALLPTH